MNGAGYSVAKVDATLMEINGRRSPGNSFLPDVFAEPKCAETGRSEYRDMTVSTARRVHGLSALQAIFRSLQYVRIYTQGRRGSTVLSTINPGRRIKKNEGEYLILFATRS